MEAAAPPPPAPVARRIDVGRVISETFSMYGQHLGVLIGPAIIIFGVVGIINGFLQDEGGIFLTLIAQILSLIASAVYTGFVVKLVQDVRQDGRRDLSVGTLVNAAMPVIGVLIVNGLLKGIAVGIGILLLIIPGIILATIWAVTAPAIVVERAGIMDAFGRSYELVRGEFWAVLGAFVLIFLIVAAAVIIGGAIGIAIGGLAAVIILTIIVGILTAPLTALVSSILFFDLGGGQTVAAAPAAPVQPPPAPAT
ncbi:MAG: hypothetical protein ACR2OC_07210 [Solirubrobacterales bacterium]